MWIFVQWIQRGNENGWITDANGIMEDANKQAYVGAGRAICVDDVCTCTYMCAYVRIWRARVHACGYLFIVCMDPDVHVQMYSCILYTCMCMYTRVYVCAERYMCLVCLHAHVCIHVCTCTALCIYWWTCMLVWTYMCVYTHACVPNVCLCTHSVCMCVCVVYTYVHTHQCTYIWNNQYLTKSDVHRW